MELSVLYKRLFNTRETRKFLVLISATQTLCSTKDESHPLFHQSVIQLTTVTLDFDQIPTMICLSSGFRCSLLFLTLFAANQTLAKAGNSANSTPVSSTATGRCNNVYNSFYAGPNKKIETLLQEVKQQLTQMQDDINVLKGNKTTVKGKNRCAVLCRDLFSDYFQKASGKF